MSDEAHSGEVRETQEAVKVPEWSPPCYMVALFMRSAVMEAFDTREIGSRVMTQCQPVDREAAKGS